MIVGNDLEKQVFRESKERRTQGLSLLLEDPRFVLLCFDQKFNLLALAREQPIDCRIGLSLAFLL